MPPTTSNLLLHVYSHYNLHKPNHFLIIILHFLYAFTIQYYYYSKHLSIIPPNTTIFKSPFSYFLNYSTHFLPYSLHSTTDATTTQNSQTNNKNCHYPFFYLSINLNLLKYFPNLFSKTK
jgi:hypothetical protein